MNKYKGLYRSRTNTVIGGVAGGIAEYLRTDPTLIRIIFILVALFGGGGLLVYVILWIALPLEPVQYFTDQNQENGKTDPNSQTENSIHQDNWHYNPNQGNLIAGLILISVGVIFLIDHFVPRIDFGDLWPLALVIAGVALIRSSYIKKLKDKE